MKSNRIRELKETPQTYDERGLKCGWEVCVCVQGGRLK